MNRRSVYYGIISLIAFAVDRISKYWVITSCPMPSTEQKALSIALTYNRGVSWSFFDSERSDVFAAVTAVVSGVVCAFAYYTYQRYHEGYSIFGNCLVLAGALSNIVDRLVYGGVVDFISFSCGRYEWPVFNVADGAIVVGALIMFLASEKKD